MRRSGSLGPRIRNRTRDYHWVELMLDSTTAVLNMLMRPVVATGDCRRSETHTHERRHRPERRAQRDAWRGRGREGAENRFSARIRSESVRPAGQVTVRRLRRIVPVGTSEFPPSNLYLHITLPFPGLCHPGPITLQCNDGLQYPVPTYLLCMSPSRHRTLQRRRMPILSEPLLRDDIAPADPSDTRLTGR